MIIYLINLSSTYVVSCRLSGRGGWSYVTEVTWSRTETLPLLPKPWRHLNERRRSILGARQRSLPRWDLIVPLKEIADPGTMQSKQLVFQTTAAADVDPDDIPEHDCSSGLGWNNAELRALVEFIMLHGTGESWPTHHRMRVWEAAASFIKTRAATTTARSSELLSCYIFTCLMLTQVMHADIRLLGHW